MWDDSEAEALRRYDEAEAARRRDVDAHYERIRAEDAAREEARYEASRQESKAFSAGLNGFDYYGPHTLGTYLAHETGKLIAGPSSFAEDKPSSDKDSSSSYSSSYTGSGYAYHGDPFEGLLKNLAKLVFLGGIAYGGFWAATNFSDFAKPVINQFKSCDELGSVRSCQREKFTTKIGSFWDGVVGNVPTQLTDISVYNAGGMVTGAAVSLAPYGPYLVEVTEKTKVTFGEQAVEVPSGTRFSVRPEKWDFETKDYAEKLDVELKDPSLKALSVASGKKGFPLAFQIPTDVRLVPDAEMNAPKAPNGESLLLDAVKKGAIKASTPAVK